MEEAMEHDVPKIVKQREFGLRSPTSSTKTLVSKNYWSSVGVAGLHSNGAPFLCHFDTPWSSIAIRDLTACIESSLNREEFEIHIYGGLSCGWGLMLALIGAAVGSEISVCAAIGGAAVGLFFVLTHLATLLMLRMHGFSKPLDITYWRPSLQNRLYEISINAGVNTSVQIRPQIPHEKDIHFLPTSSWFRRAIRSASSDCAN